MVNVVLMILGVGLFGLGASRQFGTKQKPAAPVKPLEEKPAPINPVAPIDALPEKPAD